MDHVTLGLGVGYIWLDMGLCFVYIHIFLLLILFYYYYITISSWAMFCGFQEFLNVKITFCIYLIQTENATLYITYTVFLV